MFTKIPAAAMNSIQTGRATNSRTCIRTVIFTLAICAPYIAAAVPVTWYVKSPTIVGTFVYDADLVSTQSDSLKGAGYTFPISGSVYMLTGGSVKQLAQTDLSFPTGFNPKVAQLQLATDGLLTDAGGTYPLLPYSISGQYMTIFVLQTLMPIALQLYPLRELYQVRMGSR